MSDRVSELKNFEHLFSEITGIPIFHGMVSKSELNDRKIKPPFAVYSVVEDQTTQADNGHWVWVSFTLDIDIYTRDRYEAFKYLDVLEEHGAIFGEDFVNIDDGLYAIGLTMRYGV